MIEMVSDSGIPADKKTRKKRPPLQGEIFNIAGLALFLGVSRDTVISMIRHGQIAFIRLGREYRFHRSDVMRFLEARRTDVYTMPTIERR